jgi:DNA-binding CsgD family transcriptional regulator
MDAVHARHLVVSAPEDAGERAGLAERAAKLAERLDGPAPRLWSTLWQIDGALEMGDLAFADALLARLDLQTARGVPVGRWHWCRLRAARLALSGDFSQARACSDQARELAKRTGDLEMFGLSYSFRTMLATLRGDPDELPADLAPLLAKAPDVPILQISRALVALLQGETTLARALYAQVMAQIEKLPVSSRWTGTLLMSVDLAEAFSDSDGAAVLHRLLLPAEHLYAAGPSGTVFCSGSYALPLARAAVVCGQWDCGLAHSQTAVQANERIGALPFAALAHISAARALNGRGAEGDPKRSGDHAARAAAIAERLDMPGPLAIARHLLSLQEATGPARGMSERERDVAQLVCRGLTNKEIAGALYISERTVESHVRSALQKLGLQRRTQLAAYLLGEESLL